MSVRTLLRPLPSLAAALAGLACAALGSLTAGPGAGWRVAGAALVAAVGVLAFFWTSQVPLLLASAAPPGLGLLLLLLTYVLRLLGVVAVLGLTDGSAGTGRATGLTVIACALAWVGAEVVAALRGSPPGPGRSEPRELAGDAGGAAHS